jgi:hypothetical protein
MTHIGVDAIREVERRRVARQVLHVALGRKDEHLVLEEIELDALHELGGIGHLALPVDQLPHPGELLVVAPVAPTPLLVAPVGGDARLRHLVHLVGPDLDLERLRLGADDRGVQALIHVRLGHGDVVVELARHRAPQ